MALTDERLCVTHPVLSPHGKPRHVERPNVCESCRSRLDDMLAEIPTLVAQTTDKIQPEHSRGPMVSGSRELPSPVNLTALGVTSPAYERGPRARWLLDFGANPDGDEHADQVGIGNPAAVLDQWVTDWMSCRDRRELGPPPDLGEIVLWLRNRLDWACDEHPAIDEVAQDLKLMLRALRGIVRDQDVGESAGNCPAKLRDDSRCNASLRVDPYIDRIECNRCGSSWHRRDAGWMKLRAQQDEWTNEGEAA